MKTICDSCTHQQSDGKGGVQCGATDYSYNGAYGPFKQGCVCVHDVDLIDKFAPRTGDESEIKKMSSLCERRGREITALRYEVSVLKERLTGVELPNE
jgi:hypothetical protein